MDRRLLRLGFVLIFISLLTGFAVPRFANARLGVAAHTVGLFGGLFLIVLGVVTPMLSLGRTPAAIFRWSWIYAAYANLLAGVLAAATGASRLTPIAGAGTAGSPPAETTVAFLLVSLSFASLLGTAIALWGLRDARQ